MSKSNGSIDGFDVFVALILLAMGILTLALSSAHGELKQIKKQAIEYGYGETNRVSGEFQWKEKGK